MCLLHNRTRCRCCAVRDIMRRIHLFYIFFWQQYRPRHLCVCVRGCLNIAAHKCVQKRKHFSNRKYNASANQVFSRSSVFSCCETKRKTDRFTDLRQCALHCVRFQCVCVCCAVRVIILFHFTISRLFFISSTWLMLLLQSVGSIVCSFIRSFFDVRMIIIYLFFAVERCWMRT